MANITSSQPLLRNAEEIAGNLVRKPKPKAKLSPVRTGLLPPREETGAEIESMGPITPLGRPAQTAQSGTTPMATPEEAGAPSGGLPPLDPKILAAAEQTPEMAAFKAALEAPAPVFQKVGFTVAERVALGFLAGLKGIDAVMPVIEMRRREVADVYQKAVEARAERLQGLMQLGQMSTQAREAARTNAEQERAAGFEREKFAEEKRQFGVTSKERAREFDLRQQELAEQRALRAQMGRQPTLPAMKEYTEVNAVLESTARVRHLIKQLGAGGQPAMSISAVGAWVPFLRNTDIVRNNQELVTAMANVNAAIGPDVAGKAFSGPERELYMGVIRNPANSTPQQILNAIDLIERRGSPFRDQLLRRYDFGQTGGGSFAPADSNGLTVRMKQEIDDLVKEGYISLGTSERGYPVYQRGSEDPVEVIPDAR